MHNNACVGYIIKLLGCYIFWSQGVAINYLAPPKGQMINISSLKIGLEKRRYRSVNHFSLLT